MNNTSQLVRNRVACLSIFLILYFGLYATIPCNNSIQGHWMVVKICNSVPSGGLVIDADKYYSFGENGKCKFISHYRAAGVIEVLDRRYTAMDSNFSKFVTVMLPMPAANELSLMDQDVVIGCGKFTLFNERYDRALLKWMSKDGLFLEENEIMRINKLPRGMK